MEILKYSVAGIVLIALVVFFQSPAYAADVDVYAEGAYTETDLVVYIYADINATPLVSAGVKLTYDNTKLAFVTAVKNQEDWYFGTQSGVKYAYLDPQDTGSAVVIMCGKIDEGNPTAGVSGQRKLIGTVKFNRTDDGTTPVATPETYFLGPAPQLGLGMVRPEPDEFANFVTTGEAVLDGTSSLNMASVKIRERGDANGDGVFTNLDIFAVKDAKKSPYSVIADCNADGAITNLDIFCVKDKK